MDTSKKRKAVTVADSMHNNWPTKAIPSFDSTLKVFSWPYGSALLLEERSSVKQVLEIAHSIRMPDPKWTGIACSYNCDGIGLLGMKLSVDEAFVDSEKKRNTLVDRAHVCFNSSWKLEVQSIMANAKDRNDLPAHQSRYFLMYQKTEDHLYATVDKIDKLRSIYDNLKPETIDLIRRCTTTNEIRKSMVVPTEVCPFFA